MDSMSSKKSLIIRVNDIFDELCDENKELIKCLNELNLHLIKIHSKYETIIDCNDRQQLDEWTQRCHQLLNKTSKTSVDENRLTITLGCDDRPAKSPSIGR